MLLDPFAGNNTNDSYPLWNIYYEPHITFSLILTTTLIGWTVISISDKKKKEHLEKLSILLKIIASQVCQIL